MKAAGEAASRADLAAAERLYTQAEEYAGSKEGHVRKKFQENCVEVTREFSI